MAEDLFAGLKSLTADEREALRLALVQRALVQPVDAAAGAPAQFVVGADDMARIAAAIPGGLGNVEGVYPLTPLQEGMLFHHLLAGEDDPYVLHQGMRFASREALERFVAALRTVLARHGILRSAMIWDGLGAPVQVVCRDVGLPLFELDAEGEGVEPQALAAWLVAQARLPRYRIDVAQAPLMRLLCAPERSGGWLLVVASHHLIGDRTSLGLMRGELQARLSGMPEPRPGARQFSEYALAVRAAGSEADAVFFRELLGDVDEPTAPFGLIDPIDGRAPLGEARRSLDAAFVRRLREQAGRAGVGLPTVAHLACSLVLARASGREDVMFGTVLSGRMRDAAMSADMLGMLVNTLPYRAKLAGRSTLDCVLDAQRMLAQLIAHEHAPLALARGASKIAPPTPLFGALLDYRRAEPAPEPGMPGSVVFAAHAERTSFPLTISIDEAGDALACTVQTFERVGPARVVDYFVEALRQLTDALEHAPWRAATAIDVAPAEADPQRATDTPPQWCIHRLFEVQVARTPHAPCLISDASSIDYATLDARANRLARHFRRLGVASETRVALCFERSVEAIVAMLAVLKAGGAYVPLDPAYPQARMQLLVRLSRPALILVGDGVARDAFAQAGAPVVEFKQTQSCPCCAEHDGAQQALAGLRQTPTQTAYVLFTSGSTGEPKGVAVEHRSVSAFARAHARWCALGDGDRMLQFASHSFDNSVAEIFPALSVGAAVVLRPDGPIAPDRQFVDYLARHAVTVADLPTAFWHAWARRLGEGDTACAPRPPLRLVLAGGEKAQHEALRQWLASPSTAHIRMADTYGITEATVNSIVGELTRAHADAPDALALGRPLGDTRAYVVDTQGRFAPVGVTGEICIGGPGVARGYFDRPALTAARFVPDPFGAPGTRLYRTGDLGRRTESGEIVYVGRADAQLKIRGYRIEPAEVETALRAIPGVRDAKVLARDDRLIAYVVAQDAARPREDALRACLATRLPPFMVPAAFVAVSALPVNTHGKIDAEALRAMAGRGIASDEGEGLRGCPVTAPIETVVADIWRALLERDRIERGDDFFALGGHSLLAIRVVSRVKAAIGADLGVRDLFTHPTLGAFARAVERAPRVEREPAAPAPVAYPARLSFGQERLWFLSRLDARQSAAYHLVGGLRLVGDVDVRVLKAALERIVERHEILRTVFEEQDGVPQAVLVPVTRAYAWEDADLSASGDADARVAELFVRASREPFDLAHGPLFRLTFATIAPRDHVLVAAMHHIVADGWSMSVLTSELSALYARFSAAGTDSLPPLPFQYAAHARRQRERLEARGEALDFWRNHLANAPALLTLPTDRPRPAVQDRLGASIDFVLDRPLTMALTALAARHGATLHMTLLAGYAALLSRLAGQASVVVGTPVANRPSLELERLIGFFTNTLALHIDLSGAPTVAQLLAQVKRTTLAAYENQDVPFEQVVDALNPRRERAFDPLVQTTLVWQNTPSGRVELDGVAVHEIHPEVTTAQCDLSLLMEERSGEIAGTAVYATALFERATIERYLQAWRRLLCAMTTNDSARLDPLSLASPAAPTGAPLRVTRPATPPARLHVEPRFDAPRGAPACLHIRFAALAAAAPDATAVVDDARALSYGELNAAANRLARHLRALGVAPGTRVALAVPRSVEIAVAILAILKAGGAYVPLDPAWPDERRRQTVADCTPTVVLVGGPDAATADAAASANAVLVDLYADASRWARLLATELDPAQVGVVERDAAYVIYTSGTTGRPKGVVVEHAQVVSLLGVLESALGLTASDVWTLFHSIAFDVSVWELFGALLSGARLVIVPHTVARTPDAFHALICREAVTVLSQTPGAFRPLIDALVREPHAHRLRHVLFAGEPLDASMLAPWWASSARRDTMFSDLYGITECAIYTTWRALGENDARPGAARDVGHAIDGQRVYVLDERCLPVPPGVAGEIWIGGKGLARGYLGRPALTAQRFLPDPFGSEPGARMYRSGDVGRLGTDGALEYLGRADDQVKIRGFRIEPREIATRLEAHPAVAQAIVRALADDAGGRRLVAYFTVRTTAAVPSPEALRAYLNDHLPDYMTPVAYVRVAAFRLTFNGKIDHAALPLPGSDDYSAHAYEAPCGETEIWLAELWSTLLGVARVGRRDDFFDLGGHSLLVAQLIARVREAFDVDLPMSDLFDMPVLHAFAARIVDARLAQFDPAALARLATQGSDAVRDGDGDD